MSLPEFLRQNLLPDRQDQHMTSLFSPNHRISLGEVHYWTATIFLRSVTTSIALGLT